MIHPKITQKIILVRLLVKPLEDISRSHRGAGLHLCVGAVAAANNLELVPVLATRGRWRHLDEDDAVAG